jgi:hypothetical protein
VNLTASGRQAARELRARLATALDRAAAHRFAGALALLPGALVGLGGLAIALARGFDGLYGQDAFAYIDYALGPLATALARLEAPPWFYWPPGYPILVALAAGVTGLGDRAGQGVSLVAGAAIPVLTALLARELLADALPASRRLPLALLAGAVAAVAPQLWQSSVVGMADTSAAAAAAAGAWAACRYWRLGGTRWLGLAAGGLGLALGIRWIYGLVAVPLVALALVAFHREARRRRPSESVRAAVVAALVGVAIVIPVAIPMLGAIAAGRPVPFAADFSAYQWDVANALRSTIQTLDGELTYDQAGSAYYASQPVRRYWFGLLGLLAVPGMLAVIRRPAVPAVAVLLAWPALVVGFLAGGGYQNPRFFLAAMPPLAILVALGAGLVWGSRSSSRGHARTPSDVSPRPSTARGAHAVGMALALAIAVLVPAGLASNAAYAASYTDAFVVRHAADLAAIRSLALRAPADARLITLGATPVLRHDGRADVVELYWLDEGSVAALVADGRPTYLLVDMASMRSQWAAAAPGRAVRALEREPGLEPIGSAGIWTLYRVGSRAGTALG